MEGDEEMRKLTITFLLLATINFAACVEDPRKPKPTAPSAEQSRPKPQPTRPPLCSETQGRRPCTRSTPRLVKEQGIPPTERPHMLNEEEEK
jgi:hypothetical protein